MVHMIRRSRKVPTYPGSLRPLRVIAFMLERPEDTVRDWYRYGELQPRACHRPTRALLFDVGDAAALDQSAARYQQTPTRR